MSKRLPLRRLSRSAAWKLDEQFPGTHRVDQVDAHQVSRQGLGEQDVIAQRPGPLDGFLAERQAALGLAGEVTGGGEHRQGLDEQPGISWPGQA